MEIHARSHERLREHPELVAQAEQMVADSIRTATVEVDELTAKANQVMADNGVTQSVRYGAGPLLVPAEIVSLHCGSYLALLTKADRLLGMLEYLRLRGYITNEDSDKEFASGRPRGRDRRRAALADPGKIIALLAQVGATVEKGAPLLVMEAMKMEHTLRAPTMGLVKAFHCAAGDQVSDGVELVEFEAAP